MVGSSTRIVRLRLHTEGDFTRLRAARIVLWKAVVSTAPSECAPTQCSATGGGAQVDQPIEESEKWPPIHSKTAPTADLGAVRLNCRKRRLRIGGDFDRRRHRNRHDTAR